MTLPTELQNLVRYNDSGEVVCEILVGNDGQVYCTTGHLSPAIEAYDVFGTVLLQKIKINEITEAIVKRRYGGSPEGKAKLSGKLANAMGKALCAAIGQAVATETEEPITLGTALDRLENSLRSSPSTP